MSKLLVALVVCLLAVPASAGTVTFARSFEGATLAPLGLTLGLPDDLASLSSAQMTFFTEFVTPQDPNPLPFSIDPADVLAVELVPFVNVSGTFTVFGDRVVTDPRALLSGQVGFRAEAASLPLDSDPIPNTFAVGDSFAIQRFCSLVLQPECQFVTDHDLDFFGTPMQVDLQDFFNSGGLRFRFNLDLELACLSTGATCTSTNTASWSGSAEIRVTVRDQEPLPAIPEPSSATLLLIGLLGAKILSGDLVSRARRDS